MHNPRACGASSLPLSECPQSKPVPPPHATVGQRLDVLALPLLEPRPHHPLPPL